MIDVVGAHAADEELLHERLHHEGVVVDVLEEDGLVAQRDAGVGEATEGIADLGGQLARVVRVDADEEGVELPQHRAQLGRDALREEEWDARADAEELDVLDGPQPGEEILELLVAEEQRVAAGEEHVADFRVRGDVINLPVKLRVEVIAAGVAHEPRARAIAAVGGAAVRDEEQHAVGVAMDEPGHRRVRVFAAGVGHFPRRGVRLLQAGNHLPADGTVLVLGVNEVEEVRRDGHRQLGAAEDGSGAFRGREGGEELLELLDGRDAMLELPLPVVPLRVGDVRPRAAPGGVELFECLEVLV